MIRRKQGAGTRKRRAEAGYNLVILMMVVTVLTVMTAVALPMWTAIAQRDREEELIFRGLQYAEAIRIFQRRFGRYPVRLAELYEVKPRSIRQLYQDPITNSDDWGLIFASGPGTALPGQGNQQPGQGPEGQQPLQARLEDDLPPEGEEDGREGGSGLPASEGTAFGPLGGKKKAAVGPITGVYSKGAAEKTFKVFFNQESYDQWAFTAELVSGVANAPDRPPQVPSAKTLGRPFVAGVNPQITFAQPQAPQGGSAGGGRAGGRAGGRGGKPTLQNPDQNRGGFGVPQPAPSAGGKASSGDGSEDQR